MNVHAEQPGDELHGAAVLGALKAAYASQQSQIVDVVAEGLEVSVVGERVLVVWRFKQGFTFTWSVQRYWALVLKRKLTEVLGRVSKSESVSLLTGPVPEHGEGQPNDACRHGAPACDDCRKLFKPLREAMRAVPPPGSQPHGRKTESE